MDGNVRDADMNGEVNTKTLQNDAATQNAGALTGTNPDNNLLRHHARCRVAKAIKTGKLSRPDHCQNCGSEAYTVAHHYLGYSKENQLKVLFLCRPCHVATHRQNAYDPRFIWSTRYVGN